MVHRERHPVSRRAMVGGVATSALCAGPPDARAGAPFVQAGAPAFHRFRLGDFQLTVVSDGIMVTGDPKKTFVGAPPEEIALALSASFLPTDKVVFDENALVMNTGVVNTGSRIILFDNGSGLLQAYGPQGGRLLSNLEAAGIRPADVDAVVLSHAHADHICGLVVQGRIVFGNAHYYINQIGYDFWLDPARQ